MNDTPPEVEIKMREMALRQPPEERLRWGCSMHDFSKELVTSGILHEYPNLSPAHLRAELFRRFYGNDFDPAQQKKIIDYLTRDF